MGLYEPSEVYRNVGFVQVYVLNAMYITVYIFLEL